MSTSDAKKVDLKTEIKAVEKKVKRKITRADLEDRGNLHVSDRHKKEGYTLRITNDAPGNIEYFQKLGYEIVSVNGKENLVTSSTDTPSSMGGAVTFQVGGTTRQQGAILMRIADEDRDQIIDLQNEAANEQLGMMNTNDMPEEARAGSIISKKHTL